MPLGENFPPQPPQIRLWHTVFRSTPTKSFVVLPLSSSPFANLMPKFCADLIIAAARVSLKATHRIIPAAQLSSVAMSSAPIGKLIVRTPSVNNVGFDLWLSPQPILFGRDSQANDFCMDHDSISKRMFPFVIDLHSSTLGRRHLLIFPSESVVDGVTVFSVRVQDISSNGTFVCSYVPSSDSPANIVLQIDGVRLPGDALQSIASGTIISLGGSDAHVASEWLDLCPHSDI